MRFGGTVSIKTVSIKKLAHAEAVPVKRIGSLLGDSAGQSLVETKRQMTALLAGPFWVPKRMKSS